MRVGDEELVDPVVFFGGGGLLAAPAALLRTVFVQRLSLDVARVAERNHHVGGGDEVFGRQVLRVVLDAGAARAILVLAEFVFECGQLVGNDDGYALGLGQDVEQVFDLGHDFFVLGHDLVLLQPGEALQAHLQNLLRLRVREAVQPVFLQTVGAIQTLWAIVVGADGCAVCARASEHLAHQLAVPAAGHQFGFGNRRRGRFANDADELVDIGQRHS